ISAERYFGSLWNFNGVLADGRRYFRVKPFTLAVRGLSYTRFGGNENQFNADRQSYQVQPFFIVQPWFVRGYPYKFLVNEAPDLLKRSIGSKMGVANFELRLPFTGPRRLSLIKSNFLITDLNLFLDAGVAVFDWDQLKKNPTDPEPLDGRDVVQQKPLVSTGFSLRINLFGYLVVEPYWAVPLSAPKEKRRLLFGLNFIPGW
ncbi:MAG TPA: hypothetical protein PKD78_11610, partial [Saprospiraceae bacterium]|nr:hypothetical protein [Saprospiraceae bacterium]